MGRESSESVIAFNMHMQLYYSTTVVLVHNVHAHYFGHALQSVTRYRQAAHTNVACKCA